MPPSLFLVLTLAGCARSRSDGGAGAPSRQARLCCGEVVAGVQLCDDRLPIGDQRHLLRRRAVPYVGVVRCGGADPHGGCP